MRFVMKPRLLSYLMVVLIAAAANVPVRAAELAPGPFMEGFGDRAIRVLVDTQPGTTEREVELRRLLNDHFDVDFISRFVLARFWRTASDEEKTEFRRVFEDYLIAAYGRRFSGFNGERFAVGQTFTHDNERVVVRSDVVRASGETLTVDWRVQRRTGDGAWRIVDIVVEGVSMMVTQRSEFAAVLLREGSVTALNSKLKQIIASLNGQVTKASARS